ncbi:hypothetical protein [Cellulophaga sp. Asnod2-G02]|uniref:hypothetical protein n=1 Tax=Cellulophaga sp. Asnod2-G02 TaxID=3160572 RepID=UPI00386AECFB
MDQIEFPVIRINSKTWSDPEEAIPLETHYIYTPKTTIFNQFYLNKEVADCKGTIYKIIDRKQPDNFWRVIFSFIPGVYKAELVFQSTSKTITLTALKQDLIMGIKRFETEDTKNITKDWIAETESANSIREMLAGA